MTTTELMLFGSTFIVVYALGAQSLLVNNGKYLGAFLNSFAISSCNLVLFKIAPSATLSEMIAFVLGGPFGIIAAMYTFRHLHRSIGVAREVTIEVDNGMRRKTVRRERWLSGAKNYRWWKS